MSGRLADKVSLITGAGSGIGRASALAVRGRGIARRGRGHRSGRGRRRPPVWSPAAGGVAADFRVDVTDPDDGERLAGAVVERFGAIDVLFNNAGIAGVGVLHETSVELWDRVMAVNVRGRLPHRPRGPALHDRRRPGVDHQHVLDDRGDRTRQPRLVRRVQGSGPRPDPPDAGRLRGPRDPRQRAAARDDPYAVRRSLPGRQLRRPGRRARGAQEAPADRRPGAPGGRRGGRAVPGVGRVAVRPRVRACSSTVASGARSDRSDAAADAGRRGRRAACGPRPRTTPSSTWKICSTTGHGPCRACWPTSTRRCRRSRRRSSTGRPAPARALEDIVLLPPVTRPGKIIAVGRNYHEHAAEEGKTAPADPVLFAKFPEQPRRRPGRHRVAGGRHRAGRLRGRARRRDRPDGARRAAVAGIRSRARDTPASTMYRHATCSSATASGCAARASIRSARWGRGS